MMSEQAAHSRAETPLPLLAVNRKPAGGTRPLWRSGLVWVVLGVAVLGAGVALTAVSGTADGTGAPVAAAVSPDAALPHLAALGVIAPRGGVTAVMPAESVRGAVVTGILVSEGDIVQAGDAIAALDTLPRAAANLAGAEANVRGKSAALAQSRLSLDSDAAAVKAAIALAEAQLAQAERSLARARQLSPTNAISQASLEDLQTELDVRLAQLDQARARQVRLATATDQHPDIVAAAEALRAAEADLELARIAVAEATVRAPFTGMVLSVEARIGEPVSSAGVVRIAASGPIEAELEVHQDRIADVTTGATVSLRAAAIPDTLAGKVIAIGTEVRRQAVFDADPAANTDSRVIDVRVELNAASAELARKLIGLQVVADISSLGDLP